MPTAEEIAAQEEQDRIDAEIAEQERLAALAAGGDDDGTDGDRGDDFTPVDETGGDKAASAALNADALAKISGDEAGESEGRTPPKHVPYDRFAEKTRLVKAVEETLALERQENERLHARLAELEGTGTKVVKVEQETASDKLRGLKREYNQANNEVLLDPTDDAANARLEELQIEISDIEDQLIEERVLRRIESKNADATAQTTLQDALNKVFTDFPFLVHTSPDSNAELNDDIIFYKKGLMSSGMSEAIALQKAVDKFAPAYARDKGFVKDDTGKVDDIAKKKAQLEKEARERNAAASRSQPANLALTGRGTRSSELTADNIATLAEKDFDNLPESELKKARGD